MVRIINKIEAPFSKVLGPGFSLNHIRCGSDFYFILLMCGKLRAESAASLLWMLRIHALHPWPKLTGAPTYKNSLQVRLVILVAISGVDLWGWPLFMPLPVFMPLPSLPAFLQPVSKGGPSADHCGRVRPGQWQPELQSSASCRGWFWNGERREG